MPCQKNEETHKVNANGTNVRFCVRVVLSCFVRPCATYYEAKTHGKSEEQTRLSNTRVSDEKELEEIVTV